jgi:hypothetical protein
MTKDELFKVMDVLEGPDHHSRNELILRNGRWGTCSACPRRDGHVYPEECVETKRYDHLLTAKSETLRVVEIYLSPNG